MKNGNWIPIDKNVVHFLPHDRPYSDVEALLSRAIDLDNGRQGTINGYAKQWRWGRNKVRKFLKDLGTPKGHPRDTTGTGRGHTIVLKNNNLEDQKDTKGTPKGQERDTKQDTTIYPKTNPKPKPKEKDYVEEIEEIVAHLNKQAGTKFMASTEATRKLIRARFNDGFVLDDFFAVINKKVTGWTGTEYEKHLCPDTLFRVGKFEKYVNERTTFNPPKASSPLQGSIAKKDFRKGIE
jgi:uncharacterized phage protein (TIGR02220 family)